MTIKRMIYGKNILEGVDWVTSGSVDAVGTNINFTGKGRVTTNPDINLMCDEFQINLRTSDRKYTDKYHPKAFIHIQFRYVQGKVFKGTYPIIGDEVTVTPDLSEMGEINTDFDQYPIMNFQITIESDHPLKLTTVEVYKSTRDVLREMEGGITQNEDGSYDIGENVTGGDFGGGGDGGNGEGGNGGGVGMYYASSIPVIHTVFDPFSVKTPNKEVDAYVDGYIQEFTHKRRPDFGSPPTSDHPEGEFLDRTHIPPVWAPKPNYGGYGPKGPEKIKYLYANDGRIYISWGDIDTFYITSDFIDVFQSVHGYYVDNTDHSGGIGDGEEVEWVLASDVDFEKKGTFGWDISWRYIGSDYYVEIPNTIQGEEVITYHKMFADTNVKGVRGGNMNVVEMSSMFAGSKSPELNLSELDTTYVTNMREMFSYSEVHSLDLSSFNTSNVTNMRDMFSYATNLYELDISNFNTSNVTDMGMMFSRSRLPTIDLRHFNTSKVTRMGLMFSFTQAQAIDVSNFNTSKVVSMDSMFYRSRMNYLDLSSFNLSSLRSDGLSDTFNGASATIGYARNQVEADRLNASPNKPPTLVFVPRDATGWVTPPEEDFSGTVDGEFKYVGTNLYVDVPRRIKGVDVQSHEGMFENSNILGVKSLNPNVKSMKDMFKGFRTGSLDISELRSPSVTDMSGMFMGSSIVSIDLTNLNTSNVVNMRDMFNGSRVRSINFNGIDTSAVTDMQAMFLDIPMDNISLSSLNTSSVTSMRGMFWGCSGDVLDLKGFDTTNVLDMYAMFHKAVFNSVDLSTFDTSGVENIGHMFANAKITTVYVGSQVEAARIRGSSEFPRGIKVEVK